MLPIKRAIISVSDKTGLIEFARDLVSMQVELYSTGGTLKALTDAGLLAISVEEYTEFPEMLSGRVKTLHPKIHAGILARKNQADDLSILEKHGIKTFDLVCINLYPFETVTANFDNSLQTKIDLDDQELVKAIENIDIGGPTMIRAAAKNFESIAVVIDTSQYDSFITEMKENSGKISRESRFKLSVDAFSRTAVYDAIISSFLQKRATIQFAESSALGLKKHQELRYGENPHQAAAYYLPARDITLPWHKLHGKELSFNNLIDLDAALRLARDFTKPVCAIFKHTNPCGISVGKSAIENLNRAIETDPVSYFGGIAVFNETIGNEIAAKLNESFFEIIIAKDFETHALETLQKKKNLRIIHCSDFSKALPEREIKNAAMGYLIQEADNRAITIDDLKIVTDKKPEGNDLEELLFAFQLCKFVKSNAIVFTKDGQSLAIGAGQMSRIDSLDLAVQKSKNAKLSLTGSYLGSDAFFPFKDGVEAAQKAGVRAIVQPGGSMRDQESIDAANAAGIIMAFTGVRHFRH